MLAVDGKKRCSGCKKTYPANYEHYGKCKSAKDGLDIYCRPCARKTSRKEYYRRKLGLLNHVACTKCKCAFPSQSIGDFFYKKPSGKGYVDICINCHEVDGIQRQEHPKSTSIRKKRVQNIEKIEEETRRYYEKINGKPKLKTCTYGIFDGVEYSNCGNKFMSHGRHNRYCPKCALVIDELGKNTSDRIRSLRVKNKDLENSTRRDLTYL